MDINSLVDKIDGKDLHISYFGTELQSFYTGKEVQVDADEEKVYITMFNGNQHLYVNIENIVSIFMEEDILHVELTKGKLLITEVSSA